MKQYLELLNNIIECGVDKKPARAGMPPTREINSYMMEFDLQKGFPLLTTKKMFWKGIAGELLWFLSGSTNIRDLWEYDCHIWDQDAFKYFNRLFPEHNITFEQWKHSVKMNSGGYTNGGKLHIFGDCGRIYGYQWRNFEGVFDQIDNLIKSIKTNPDSRYHIVSAWNPNDFLGGKNVAALPACHMMFQCFVRGEYLDMIMYQRSCDTFLGVPFNIASYALLDTIIANITGYKPGVLSWVGGSVHIYHNHFDAVKEQLSRKPKELPTLRIVNELKNIHDLKLEDFVIENYDPYPTIKAELSVGI